MNIEIIEHKGKSIAVPDKNVLMIKDLQDAIDLLGNCNYLGANNIIINQSNITNDFFELKSGIAGDILQKFSNYQMKLAIVGDFTVYKSNSLKDFIFESNKIGNINFVDTFGEAKDALV